MGDRIKAGDVELWVERHGQGPDVLLIAGLGDPAAPSCSSSGVRPLRHRAAGTPMEVVGAGMTTGMLGLALVALKAFVH